MIGSLTSNAHTNQTDTGGLALSLWLVLALILATSLSECDSCVAFATEVGAQALEDNCSSKLLDWDSYVVSLMATCRLQSATTSVDKRG